MARKRLEAMTLRLSLVGLFVLAAAPACNLNLTDSGKLSPARALRGRWVTAIPVTVRYWTDFCNDAGTPEQVMQSNWTVTWDITETSDPNVVDIQMYYGASGTQRVASSCGTGSTGYVPLVSPQFLQGDISSSAIHVTGDAIEYAGSFTTDLMMGTWNHWECLIYCFGETTGTNQLKFVRQ